MKKIAVAAVLATLAALAVAVSSTPAVAVYEPPVECVQAPCPWPTHTPVPRRPGFRVR